MLWLSVLSFLLAAIFGLYLLSYVLRNKETPKTIAFIHGPLAFLGLICLLIYTGMSQDRPILSLILFILAAIGGSVLIYRDLTGKTLPKWMAIGHGTLALLGFVFLLAFIFVR